MIAMKVQMSCTEIKTCCVCGKDVQRTEPRDVLACGHKHMDCGQVIEASGGNGTGGGIGGVIGSGGNGGNGVDSKVAVNHIVKCKESAVKVALNKLFNWVVK